MTDQPMIETRHLRYRYDNTQGWALDDVSFCAPKGKITGLIGPNGAGKSTLFLNLNGVLTPSEGQVLLDGAPVSYTRSGIRDMRRRVGIVFQDPDDQLFSADVYRDISFGAVNLGLPKEEIRRRVEDAMARTGVSELRQRPTHALSYGQKKRVAIAGVLVMQPDVIVLDEPTAGLDPKGVSDIMKLLRDMRDQMGMTIIVATHDIDIVPLYCDYAYLLKHGKLLLDGTPDDIFARPDVLRANNLRLPRIAHLMEILSREDGISVDCSAATIGRARKEILRVLEEN